MAHGKRQDLSQYGSEPIEVLARRPSRAKRNREWERRARKERGVVTYRGIPPDLQERLKEIAATYEVPVGDVARLFIEHGLRAYEAGELEIKPALVTGRFTLFPR